MNIFEMIKKGMKFLKKKLFFFFLFSLFILFFFALLLCSISLFLNSLKIDSKTLEWLVKFILGIGGIFTLAWSMFSHFHTKKLEYTLDERKEWRNELRKVLIRLRTLDEKEDDEKTNEYNKCKAIILSNLNPFPSRGSIDKIVLENFNRSQENLPAQIIVLESLLKFDWERAKLETRICSSKLKKIEKDLVQKLEMELKNTQI